MPLRESSPRRAIQVGEAVAAHLQSLPYRRVSRLDRITQPSLGYWVATILCLQFHLDGAAIPMNMGPPTCSSRKAGRSVTEKRQHGTGRKADAPATRVKRDQETNEERSAPASLSGEAASVAELDPRRTPEACHRRCP